MSKESYACDPASLEVDANLETHCGKFADAVEKCDETKCADRDALKAKQDECVLNYLQSATALALW